jgi:hypothetical protein
LVQVIGIDCGTRHIVVGGATEWTVELGGVRWRAGVIVGLAGALAPDEELGLFRFWASFAHSVAGQSRRMEHVYFYAKLQR